MIFSFDKNTKNSSNVCLSSVLRYFRLLLNSEIICIDISQKRM